MKRINIFLLLPILCFLLFTNMKCKKDNQNPVDQLPAATQTGANTFGCLVNGQVFLPKGALLGPAFLTSYYQYLNSPTAQGYYFNVSASKKSTGNITETIHLDIISDVPILKGKIYSLKELSSKSTVSGSYILSNVVEVKSYKTQNTIYMGELIVTNLDDANQIVSGTFWFDAVNDKGEKVEVREGRFDVHFVK